MRSVDTPKAAMANEPNIYLSLISLTVRILNDIFMSAQCEHPNWCEFLEFLPNQIGE